MKPGIGFSLLLLIASCSQSLKAQKADSLNPLSTPSILSYEDSLSIFQLIDSLLTLEEVSVRSMLAARVSYNSNVLAAGRTLGIEQFGLAPGLAYYHTSGLYVDVSAYWSKDFEPSYYLTIFSAGYMRTFNKWFSFIASYDRYLYNLGDDAYIPYENAFTLSPYFNIKFLTIRSDYSFYAGDETAHRLMPSISINLEKKQFLKKIDKLLFAPAVYLLFGNETLTDIEIIFPTTRLERLRNYYLYGTPYKTIVTKRNVFGLMNYAYSFPLTVSYKNWTFNFSYTYSIPRALDDEPLLLSENSFLAGGITYYINLKKKKVNLFDD
jgi:hypothetical protein